MTPLSTQSVRQKISFVLFISSFTPVGLMLMIWFGIGWLALFHVVRRIILTTPLLYIPALRVLINSEVAEEEKAKIFANGGNLWYKSVPSLLLTMLYIGFTIFIFCKANISVIGLIRLAQ